MDKPDRRKPALPALIEHQRLRQQARERLAAEAERHPLSPEAVAALSRLATDPDAAPEARAAAEHALLEDTL